MRLRGKPVRWAARGATIVIAVLFVVPIAASALAGASPAGAPTAAPPVPSSSPGINTIVTWNGFPITLFGSASSALSTYLNTTVRLVYNWTSAPVAGGPPPHYIVTSARLSMLYLGLALPAITDILTNPVPATGGVFTFVWDPAYLHYLIAGLYQFSSTLLDNNGTTVWTENFYVHITAPFYLLTALPLLLVVLIALEAYTLARSGRHAQRPGPKSTAPKAWEPPKSESAPTTQPPEEPGGGST